jgi:hypothetical protein
MVVQPALERHGEAEARPDLPREPVAQPLVAADGPGIRASRSSGCSSGTVALRRLTGAAAPPSRATMVAVRSALLPLRGSCSARQNAASSSRSQYQRWNSSAVRALVSGGRVAASVTPGS